MNFTKFIAIFSAILVQTTSASFNYKFKPQNLSSYEIQETIIGHSSMECCIYCRINFFCEAVMFAEGNSCILLTQIQIASDGSASDGSAADGSAADGSASDGSAADGSAADGSAADGSAADGSSADGSAAEGSAADGSAADGSADDGSAADWSAADGSASEGSAAEGSAAEGSAAEGSASNTLAYVLKNRYCSTFSHLRIF